MLKRGYFETSYVELTIEEPRLGGRGDLARQDVI
jgi:hypothetical protein